jgi:hypothetical protein
MLLTRLEYEQSIRANNLLGTLAGSKNTLSAEDNDKKG